MTKRLFGFELLREQIVSHVEASLLWCGSDAVGDSEIEKILFCAIHAAVRYRMTEFDHLALFPSATYAALQETGEGIDPHCLTLFMKPQAIIDQYRVDFLISSAHIDAGSLKWSWRHLVVECDGHDFHERTKEQAAHDRARDRDLVLRGYEVFRFTGSELWRDPLGCALQILGWATKVRC